MKIKLLILILLSSYSYCNAQYAMNEKKNAYFNDLINQNKSNKTVHFIYQHLWDLWTDKAYTYIGSKTNNLFNNKQDSTLIMQFILKNDTDIFNAEKLIENVKNNQMVAYNYANPKIKYTANNIDSIRYLADTICKEFNGYDCNVIKIKNPDSSETLYKYITTINTFGTDDFEVYLEIKKKKNKINSIKVKGVTLYYESNDPSTGNFKGLAGLCCFLFKN